MNIVHQKEAVYDTQKIFTFALSIIVIFFCGNYLGIQDKLGIGKIKNKSLKALAIVVSCFDIILIGALILGLIGSAIT